MMQFLLTSYIASTSHSANMIQNPMRAAKRYEGGIGQKGEAASVETP